MKVYLTSLGCRLNEAELQTWSHDFLDCGILTTNELTDANLVVINTCAVTGEAARKSRQAIRRIHRQNAKAKLVVTGCYASIERQEAGSILGVDLVVANQDKKRLPALAKELLEWDSMPYAATEPDETSLFNRNRERAFIKVQDGCRYRCTYCIVTIARGDEESRSIGDIVSEIAILEQSGIQEIVITGVHVGGYGSDFGSSLYDLTVALLEQTTIPRIRFASVEPWDLPEDFFALFENKRLMPHMHLPIQSGSDKILKKMSRRCKSATFLELVKKARHVVPEFNITSDVIVGFPAESEEDFKHSLSMVKKAEFGHVHIFSFSKRQGTKAAGLAGQIDESVKKQRSRKLHAQALEVKIKVLNKMIGKTESVLWEGQGKRQQNGKRRFFGYTPNYHKVQIDVADVIKLTNEILPSRLVSVSENYCLVAEISPETLIELTGLNIRVLS
ncbi:MAG: tRNA (N(6)-L-threonylcarbamoyladenosine(37)-C(2))-methylthiotransferase MtaB [Kangiellaceae bacterium]|nr:tRNA (N(6)-L-threonylcarbamoyladenosine(37)-C(2))-methylthiotransferase MtaB [Kangiellaceae bacterium]